MHQGDRCHQYFVAAQGRDRLAHRALHFQIENRDVNFIGDLGEYRVLLQDFRLFDFDATGPDNRTRKRAGQAKVKNMMAFAHRAGA